MAAVQNYKSSVTAIEYKIIKFYTTIKVLLDLYYRSVL
jgi:hypothetical protein